MKNIFTNSNRLYSSVLNSYFKPFQFKKYSFVVYIFVVLCLSFELQSQDLIQQIRSNTLNENTSTAEKSQSAKLIEQNHKAAFIPKVQPFALSTSTRLQDFQDYVSDAVFYEINPKSLSQIAQQKSANIVLSLPILPNQPLELLLTQVQITTPDFALSTSDGRRLEDKAQAGVFYQGTVKGKPHSMVAFSVYEQSCRALIADEQGNYVLAALKERPETYILYNDNNLQVQNDFVCGTDDVSMNLGSGTTGTFNENNCVEVYIECDYHTYQSHNSNLANVQNYVTSLFNEVAIIYQNEDIVVQLSEIHVWTSTDPYASLTSTHSVLYKFGEEKQDNYNGRLAHLISTRSLGGGVAWVDVLCRTYTPAQHAGPYAVSAHMNTTVAPFPTYSWDVMVFSHEMGHNFGSRHTHSCVWGPNNDSALDNCATSSACAPGPPPTNGGTIMSYCHITSHGINFNNGFGQEPGDLIRNRYNFATCELTCEGDGNCQIECPADITVTCDDDYMDLNVTGMATANCGGTGITHADQTFFNGCQGYVLRTFEVTDGTTTASCVQRIDIVQGGEGCSALDFNGGDYATLNTQIADDISQNFTFEAWIKAEDAEQDPHPIILSNRSSSSQGFMFFFHNDWGGSTNKLLCVQLDGTNYMVTNYPDVLDGTCHHVAAVRDGSRLHLYRDGHVIGTRILPVSIDYSSSQPLRIAHDMVNNNSMNGLIEEVRVWNVARSTADIQDNMHNPLSGNEAGLVAYYDMQEGSGQVLQDLSPNGHDGTLGASGGVDNADPTWVTECCVQDEDEDGVITFIVGEGCEAANNTLHLPVSTKYFENVNGFQFSVHVDPNIATITGVNGFGLSNWDGSDFTIDASSGTITVTREADDTVVGESVPDNTVLFNIVLNMVGTPGSDDSPYIDGTPTPVLVVQNSVSVIPELIDGSLCIGNLATLAGNITAWYNPAINDVSVALSMGSSTSTNASGNFSFANLELGNDIMLTPSKDMDAGNGVDIQDVIAVKQHIFNQNPFTSPFQLIAADANGSNTVTMLDIVFIKQIIREEIMIFPVGKSWRFVPDDYNFPNPNNPFPFPEERNYNPLNMSYMNEDFIGTKIGDVTGDAATNLLSGDDN